MLSTSRLAAAAILLAGLVLSACQSSPGGDYRNATVNRIIATDGIGQADDN